MKSSADSETINKSYVRIYELDAVTEKDREIGYVISNMREPCSQYLSLWSYGSTKVGQLYWDMEDKGRERVGIAYGQNPPLFDTEEDISAFRNVWLKDEMVDGLIAKRFNFLYPHNDTVIDSPPGQVDCWIFVENFQESVVSCLKQYESKGGSVKWDSPLLSKIVEQLDEMKNHRRLAYQKNNALGFGETNPQNSHHSNCSKYFDDNTAHAIETGPESIIYSMFGYEGCCKTGRKQTKRRRRKRQGEKNGSKPRIAEDTKSHDILYTFDNTISQGGNERFVVLSNDTKISNQGHDEFILEALTNGSMLTFIKIQTVLVLFFFAIVVVRKVKNNILRRFKRN